MKRMTRVIALMAALAILVAACGDGGGGGDTTVPGSDTTGGADTTTGGEGGLTDLGGATVTVGVENAYLPFNFILAGETEGQGWDYDAWNDICERLNCVPEFVESAWPAVIDQVANGELDTAADGISITDERKEIVDRRHPLRGLRVERRQADDERKEHKEQGSHGQTF